MTPCLLSVGKKIIDIGPVIVGFGVSFFGKSTPIILLGVWLGFASSVLALVVGYAHCKLIRWNHGLPATFPKVIPLTFLLLSVILLICLYVAQGMGELEEVAEGLRYFGGSFSTGGLFFAAAASIYCSRKSFIAVEADEMLGLEKVEEFNNDPIKKIYFDDTLDALSKLWMACFALMFCTSLACGLWQALATGSEEEKEATRKLAGTISSIATPSMAAICAVVLQPRVMTWAEEQTWERLAAEGASDGHSGNTETEMSGANPPLPPSSVPGEERLV